MQNLDIQLDTNNSNKVKHFLSFFLNENQSSDYREINKIVARLFFKNWLLVLFFSKFEEIIKNNTKLQLISVTYLLYLDKTTSVNPVSDIPWLILDVLSCLKTVSRAFTENSQIEIEEHRKKNTYQIFDIKRSIEDSISFSSHIKTGLLNTKDCMQLLTKTNISLPINYFCFQYPFFSTNL